MDKEFLEMMKDLLKEDYDSYLASFDKPPFSGIRINTTKIKTEEFVDIFPFVLKKIPWTDDGFYIDNNDKDAIAKHPYHYAGLYYLQEPSAMLPAVILDAKDEDVVLDVCAAPGGKSTKIGADLNGKGLLVSNDISASRANALLRNIEKFGFKNTYVLSVDIEEMRKNNENYFDKILIDAPCSGEGMFRKDPSMIKNYRHRSKEEYIRIQRKIVDDAYYLLKEGGKMVYSTCTFDPGENEAVIDYLLTEHPDIKIIECNVHDSGFNQGISYNKREELAKALRLYPFKIDGEGHFICHLKKDGDHKSEHVIPESDIIKNDSFHEFLSLINWPKDKKYKVINDDIYLLPDISFDTSHLRIIRSGLYLGQIKKKNFEPSQALALALKAEEFKYIINLDVDDNRAIKYLKGETIDMAGLNYHEGYNLVCVNGFSLGFAKINNGVFKNKIASGWIYR